jgi:polysaccharide deacetylase family sporulation protein PdaB
MYCAIITKKRLFLALTLLLVTILSISLLCSTGAYAVFYGKAVKKLPIYYVKTTEKKIALSFDCAWGTDYTDELLQVMSDKGVKSTFFMVEFWTKKHSDYVKKIDEQGHEIGTHSSTHPYMSKLDKKGVERELRTSSEAIESIINKKTTLFRAPYGDYNDQLIDTAKEMGLYTIQWDVDSLDWKDLSADQIYDRVIRRVRNGSIILFHNQGLHTAKALPKIIDELKNQGYQFTTIGDLIYKDGYQMAVDGGQEKYN